MSTSGPEETPQPSELQGLDPKDLLRAGLETVPPVTLPPQPVDPDATIAVAGPRPSQPSAPQVELPLPEELTALLPAGAYHVESFLGQGGMGAVYKGMQVRLKRPVAIKIMHRALGKDYDFEQRFEREAQAMAKLNHPNIVSVIDFGEAGPDYLYIVMELVNGADLMDVIRGGQMTQEMALTLLPQICDALQFAHDHGIVHRDIKPSNIMLTRDGRIKMADFGLAKRFDAESSFRTQTGTGMGTPDYAAPEQFDPNSNIDHRADIYALGVMIYQMITGTLPRGVWKPPSQRAEVAPQWDSIVSRAMQSDPKDRYQQASEVKTDVSSIPLAGGRAAGPSAAANVPATVQSPNAALGGPSAMPKSRAPLLIGLVAAAVAISFGSFFVMKKPAPANSVAQAADAVPASAQDSSDAKASRTKASTASIQWQRANWTEEDLKKKTIVADGDWGRIGQKAGASNGWPVAANGETVSFVDGVVRLRYRWEEGGRIALKVRHVGSSYGQVVIWGQNLDLSMHIGSSGGRVFQKATLPTPLHDGDEGTLEIAAIGKRLYARVNNSIVLASPEIPELSPTGLCAVHSENGTFRGIEYAILDGIADPLKALGWVVPNAVESALAAVSPAVRPYVAYPERLKVPVPDWLRLASAEGGLLRIHTVGGPGAAKAALDLGEAARFDDFVFVAGQDLGWIAVRRNGELWGRTADYKGQPKSVGPIQIKSLSTGMHCHWLDEAGTGGTLYGSQHHTFPVSGWKSARVTAASLHSAVASFAGGKPHRLAFDSAGNLLAHFSEVTRPDYQFPPSDWFRGAPQPKLGDGLAALTHDGRVRTWDFTTGAAFPGMEEVRGVVQLAYGSGSAGWGVMLSETGQATVFGSKGTEVPEDLAPPAKGGPFIRVSPGPVFAAQKMDGSWVGWNSKERNLVAAIESFGPMTSIASGRVSFRDGDYAEKPVNIPYLIYIQPKNGSKPGVSNAPTATKITPFVNSLGMKFVPVPVTGGPTDKQRVLFSVWETRVQDYEVFVKETKREWPKPDFEQEATHPAVNVSWDDAAAFCVWLTERECKTGKLAATEVYRLPSDHEWSCAVGIGHREDAAKLPAEKQNLIPGIYPWGTTWPAPNDAVNVWSGELNPLVAAHQLNPPANLPARQDGHAFTAPVGSFAASALGLHDLGGNLREWAEGWYDASKQRRVARGGSWAAADHGNLLSSQRVHHLTSAQHAKDIGFRVVLAPAPAAAVTPSPNLPVSQSSDPRFPPGQWVKLFTKPEDLPADLRKPDSGVTWEDGWIRNLKAVPSTLPLPRSLVGNIGVRFHQQASWKEGKLAATVYLKNGPAIDGPTDYMMQIDAGGTMQAFKGAGEKQKYLPISLRRMPPSLLALDEMDVEYAIIGDRIVTRAGGTELMMAKETISKRAPGHVVLYTAIRDIEVINLDGLPETEALRLLGVDEQGKDLRGKTAAAETWENLLNNPKKLQLGDNLGTKITAEGLQMAGKGTVWFGQPTNRNGAVKIVASMSSQARGLTIRGRMTADVSRIDSKFYSVALLTENEAVISLTDNAAKTVPVRRLFPISPPLRSGQEFELEVRIVGDQLTAKLNGKLLGELTDSTLQSGRFAVASGQDKPPLIKSLEFLDLDHPAVSPSSVGTATKDSPFTNTLGMKFVPVPITGPARSASPSDAGGGPTDKQRVLFSVWDVRVRDFETFVTENGYDMDQGEKMHSWREGKYGLFGESWHSPGFKQTAEHPVVGISWEDAKAFCEWLTKRERSAARIGLNEEYRLPSDHEWSCAVGIGDREDPKASPKDKNEKIKEVFPWGTQWPPPKGAGNYGDDSAKKVHPAWSTIDGYDDGFAATSPVGTFSANQYGLFDMGGNVWQWCEDPWESGARGRVIRGGSFGYVVGSDLLSSCRSDPSPTSRVVNFGFRCVLAPAANAP